ncbi:hypothetical protein IAU59_000208 [Kwoniella sp. CBS 9459]
MGDLVSSALGSELGDSEIVVALQKPIWHLVPLPLAQIRPSAIRSLSTRGTVPSLHSSCLSVISRYLHRYSLASFEGTPPPLVRRIISRIRADRGYEEDYEDRTILNPDEATIWALSALLDPEGLADGDDGQAADFTLGVSNISVLGHLTPNSLLKHPDHPLVELPKLYNTLRPSPQCKVSLLTTLTLDGMDGAVNDQNIQSLKYCTHLTILWMKGCRVTDSGIKLLTSSLELPGPSGREGGRGLWRLRAWSVSGCKGVGDRSMRCFARLPGLVMLDIRDTSCTTSAIDIFNRTSRNLFSGANVDLQPCTDGLLRLFARNSTSAEILDSLRMTLIKSSPSEHSNSSDPVDIPRQPGPSHIALHIVPSARPLQERWLPSASLPASNKKSSYHRESKDAKSVYRSNGVGQIYGTSVSSVVDEAKDFRWRLNTSMQIQYEKEHALAEQVAYDNMSTVDKRKFTMKKNRKEKEDREFIRYGKIPEREKRVVAGKIVKPSRKQKNSDEQSKKFVRGSKDSAEGGESEEEDGLKGERKLMLVRMVNANWETLTWTTNGGTGEGFRAGGAQTAAVGGSSRSGFWGRVASQKVKAGILVQELLSSTQSQATSISRSPSSPSANVRRVTVPSAATPAMRPTTTTESSMPATPVKSEHGSQHSSFSAPGSSRMKDQSQRARINPFKSGPTISSPMGIRPLSSQPFTSPADPSPKESLPRPTQYNLATKASQGPFSQTIKTKLEDTGSDFAIKKQADIDDGLSFSSVCRKRTFGGVAGGNGPEQPKRRGMKMFSIGAGETR